MPEIHARRVEEHHFVLVLSGISELGGKVMDALFEAGCDDATPSLRFGTIYLTFSREASSLKHAIMSAIRDIQRSGINAEVIYVDQCHLVSQSDIGRRIKRTRQQVGQYVSGKRGPGNFPGPVCDLSEGNPLWRWSDVSFWLWRNGMVGEDILKDSRLVATINSTLELRAQERVDPSLVKEVSELLDESSSRVAVSAVSSRPEEQHKANSSL